MKTKQRSSAAKLQRKTRTSVFGLADSSEGRKALSFSTQGKRDSQIDWKTGNYYVPLHGNGPQVTAEPMTETLTTFSM